MLRIYLEKDAARLIRSDENSNCLYIKQIFNSVTKKFIITVMRFITKEINIVFQN